LILIAKTWTGTQPFDGVVDDVGERDAGDDGAGLCRHIPLAPSNVTSFIAGVHPGGGREKTGLVGGEPRFA